MTLKEADVSDSNAVAEMIREVGDAAARASPSPRFPKRTPPRHEAQFELFPSPHESAAAQRYLERRSDPDAKSPLNFRLNEAEKFEMFSADHVNDHVAARLVAMDTFATGLYEFSQGMLDQLKAIAVDRWGQLDAARLSQAVSFVQGIGPKTELEAMLAVQMAAVHLAALRVAEENAHAMHPERQQWTGSNLARLSRTFSMQVDTLKNLRLNGHQHIHIHHHRTEDGLRGVSKKVRQSHAPKPGPHGNQTRQSPQSAALRRQIKAIAKGMPRPRSARS